MSTVAQHDVVVVGARAAGSATALLLARLGHDVGVVERAELPSDTVSTHVLSRTGVVSLDRWGLLDAVIASGAPPIRAVTFHTEDGCTTFRVKDKSGVDCLVAPRRYILDTLLANAARDAGARVHMGVSVHEVIRGPGGRAAGVRGRDLRGAPVEIRARFIVGADGLGSTVAQSVGAPIVVDRGAGGATQYAYFSGLPWPEIEFFTRPGSYAGVFPTHHGEAAIWVCTPSAVARAARRTTTPEAAYANLLARAAPTLVTQLRHAQRTSKVRGMLSAPNQIRRAVGPGWALVGDAACHRDPITGHGLSDAYRDAELLALTLDGVLRAEVAEPAALEAYDSTRRRELAQIFDLTCRMAAFPPVPAFTDLTRRLGAAIDDAAAVIAARPVPAALVAT
jgi:2-polyprenyl-6-methoxyphenol hydroxylase-like FAD-dependent oxidoreductase